MRLTPHLTFAGSCEDAFKFYETCLVGKIVTMITYGDSPLATQTPPKWHKKILHATMTIGEGVLVGADVLTEQYERPQGFFVVLTLDELVEAQRAFQALSAKGRVLMQAQKTFWAPFFGVAVDRFGIPWEVTCEEKPD